VRELTTAGDLHSRQRIGVDLAEHRAEWPRDPPHAFRSGSRAVISLRPELRAFCDRGVTEVGAAPISLSYGRCRRPPHLGAAFGSKPETL